MVPHPPAPDQQQQQQPAVTRFLALDKCLPGRNFLQVGARLAAPAQSQCRSPPPTARLYHPRPQLVEFPDADGPLEFSYDDEWLAILRSTHSLTSLQQRGPQLPPVAAPVSPVDLADVRRRLEQRGGARVPDNFVATVHAYDPAAPPQQGRMPRRATRNPQTEALMQLLGLPYTLDVADSGGGAWQARDAAPAGEVGACMRARSRVRVCVKLPDHTRVRARSGGSQPRGD